MRVLFRFDSYKLVLMPPGFNPGPLAAALAHVYENGIGIEPDYSAKGVRYKRRSLPNFEFTMVADDSPEALGAEYALAGAAEPVEKTASTSAAEDPAPPPPEMPF